MSIGLWFFCPGMPAPAIRRVYEDAASFFDTKIRWVGLPGRSAVFTAEAKRLLGLGRGSVLEGLEIAYPMPTPVQRAAVAAFSAGYGAPRMMLSVPRDVAALDGLALLDALHAGFDRDGTAADAQIAPFADYAKHAIEGNAVFVTGHTDVKTPQPPAPAAFASTTQSHAELVRLGGAPAGHFVIHKYDQFDDVHQMQEHAAALTGWGPILVSEMLARVAGVDLASIDDNDRPTRPTPLPALPPHGDVGELVLAAAIRDLEAGVDEDLGKNDGTEIREMAKMSPGGWGPGGNWCAVAASAWLAVGAPGLVTGSHGAKALKDQLRHARGVTWYTAAQLRATPLVLRPGAVCFWDRAVPGRPETSWWGHVGIFERLDGKDPLCIEGNSGADGRRVARMPRPLADPRLLGAAVLPAAA